MKNPDSEIQDLVTDMVTSYQRELEESGEEKLPFAMAFVNSEGEIVTGYVYCSYGDLNGLSITFRDEAILRMLAIHQDRIQKFREELEDDEDDDAE